MSQKTHDLAEQYFIEQGMMPPKEDRTEVWVLHHIDESLRHTDKKRYNEWRIEDLVPMSNSEHMKYHHRCDSTKQRIIESHTGKHHSKETRKKMSDSHTGKKRNPEDHNEQWRKKHSEAMKIRYKCPYCDYENNKTYVTMHISQNHGEKV